MEGAPFQQRKSLLHTGPSLHVKTTGGKAFPDHFPDALFIINDKN